MKKAGDNSKQALLLAAKRLFAVRGINAVKLSEVADAAGIDACMIHYHFGGKSGLIEAVVKSALDRWHEIQLDSYFARNHELLETREGQQVFIAGMVEKVFSTMGGTQGMQDPANVIFLQVLQSPCAARDEVIGKHIKPLVNVFYEVYRKITGSDDFDSAFCWFLILVCPNYVSMVNPGMIDPLHPTGKIPETFHRRLQYATTQLLLHGLGLI